MIALVMYTSSWIGLGVGIGVIILIIAIAAYLWKTNGVDPLRSDKEFVDEEEAGMY